MFFELLERRQLMSVSLNTTTGILTVNETSVGDYVRISQNSTNVDVQEGSTHKLTLASKVTGIVVNCGDGNDTVVIDTSLHKPTTLNGGNGNDSLEVGGSSADIINGGAGWDIAGYYTRSVNLTLKIGAGAVSGATNEHDDIKGDIEEVIGGSKNDTIVGSPSDNRLSGFTGNDTITGGGGNDLMFGGEGDDSLDGGSGNDSVQGSPGDDEINGGDGNDLLNGGDGFNTIHGGAGDDTLTGGAGGTEMQGEDGNDVFINTNGSSDFGDGGAGINLAQDEAEDGFANVQTSDPTPGIIGKGPGAAPAFAAAPAAGAGLGAAAIIDGDGNVTVDHSGDTNAVTVIADINGSNVRITDGASVQLFPIASVKKITMFGGGGKDFLSTFNLNIPALLFGGANDDTLVGGNQNDNLFGNAGNDSIIANAGDDSLVGGAGNDSLFGGNGTDFENGGSTDDFYNGGDGTDFIKGGPGNDYADYRFRTDNLTLRLDGTSRSGAPGELDKIDPTIENLLSGAGNDTLVGNSLANYLSGGGGADNIFGNGGNDAIVGSFGADKAFGNTGFDFIYLSGDGFADGYNFGTSTAEFIQRDTTNPTDFVTNAVNPPA